MTAKTFAFLMIIFSFRTSGWTQSKFSFGINTAYFWNYRIITEHYSDVYKDYRNSNEGVLKSINPAALVLYRISKHCKIETGFGYFRNGYDTKEKVLIDPGFSPITENYRSSLNQFTNDNLYVPLHLVYLSGKKLHVYYSTGASILFPLSSKVRWVLRRNLGSSQGQTTYERQNTSPDYSRIIWDLGIGIGHSFLRKFELILQPQLSYSLAATENTYIRDNLYYIGLFNNENKSTKEHLYSYGVCLKIMR